MPASLLETKKHGPTRATPLKSGKNLSILRSPRLLCRMKRVDEIRSERRNCFWDIARSVCVARGFSPRYHVKCHVPKRLGLGGTTDTRACRALSWELDSWTGTLATGPPSSRRISTRMPKSRMGTRLVGLCRRPEIINPWHWVVTYVWHATA